MNFGIILPLFSTKIHMTPSTHFKLNTGAQIPAVGLGMIQALVYAGLDGDC
jgi:hypothetical protein